MEAVVCPFFLLLFFLCVVKCATAAAAWSLHEGGLWMLFCGLKFLKHHFEHRSSLLGK